MSLWLSPLLATEKNEEVKDVAETFIKTVDNSDADGLRKVLHPEMLQFTQLNGKLIPFKGSDFVKMVEDKKLGGVPRKITHKSAKVLRNGIAEVTLQATSSEYDFMYQISLAKTDGKWLIVGVVNDAIKQ